METVAVVGVDLAKAVFQMHGVDESGAVVLRRRVSRGQFVKLFTKLPPCLVGMEACSSSHHWARQLMALGHEVKLMPAQYVKPYLKRGKNDAADAEAICEAVTRPTMRFVGVKTPEQQAVMMLHRVRKILTRQRTQLTNALRAHLAEFGITAPVGRIGLDRLLAVVADPNDDRLPAQARRPSACTGTREPCRARQPAGDGQGADPRQRPADHGRCPQERGRSPLDEDPGDRTSARQRDPCLGR